MTWTTESAYNNCSFRMDKFNGVTVHLNHCDITMTAVSRAPYPGIATYKQRMGWTFPWYSSAGSDFNFANRVSFTPDELSAGEVEYNYLPTRWSGTEGAGICVMTRRRGDFPDGSSGSPSSKAIMSPSDESPTRAFLTH